MAYTPLLTLTQVSEWVAEIKALAQTNEPLSAYESRDKLWEAVLQAAANGRPNVRKLADVALEVRDLPSAEQEGM